MPKGKHRKTRSTPDPVRLQYRFVGLDPAPSRVVTHTGMKLTDADAREIVRALRDLNRKRGLGDDGPGIRV